MISVPERFNKNAPQVLRLGPPAETGSRLIEYMCRRIGIADLGQSRVLDFGCGCRFAETFVNSPQLPIGHYVGIDVDSEMIDWLNANIDDPRLQFHWWNARNPNYNPSGEPLSDASVLPVGNEIFDIACMFSVITHQLPDDAECLLRLLRSRVAGSGHLFFSATLEPIAEGYRELVPAQATAHSAYSEDCLRAIVERAGWRIVSIEPKSPRGPAGVVPIQDSILCVPAT